MKKGVCTGVNPCLCPNCSAQLMSAWLSSTPAPFR
jgi:hypothetical protein